MNRRLAAVLHFLIVITTCWAVAVYFNGEPDVLGSRNAECFRYFTTDSNVLAALASLLYLICRKERPRALVLVRFAGTVAVTVTLLTVLFFLIPMAAFRGRGLAAALPFFSGNVFVLHLSTPVLSILACLIPEEGERFSRKQALLCGLLPATLYGVLYMSMVVSGLWRDWYGFTFGGRWGLIPVVAGCMLLAQTGIILGEHALKNRLLDGAEM